MTLFLVDVNEVREFVFIFIRISGIFLFAPVYGSQNIPVQLKVLFSALVSYIVSLTGVVSMEGLKGPALYTIFSELLYGILIGYITYTYTSVFFTMGKIVDFKLGFGMANVVDPQTRMQVSMFGNFFYIFSTLIFLSLDGHHFILTSVVNSYKVVGLGRFLFQRPHLDMAVEAFIKAFEVGAILSFPIILTILISDFLLGVLSKTMPQLNIFVVGMPLKIIVGIAMIMLMIPAISQLTINIYELMTDAVFRLLRIG